MVLRAIERRSNGQFQLRGSDKRIFKFEKKRPLEKKLVIKRSSRPSCVPGSSLRSSSSPPFGKKRTCWSEYSSSVVFIAGSSQHSSRAEPKNIASKKTFGLESQTKDFVRSFHILINIIFHANIIYIPSSVQIVC